MAKIQIEEDGSYIQINQVGVQGVNKKKNTYKNTPKYTFSYFNDVCF